MTPVSNLILLMTLGAEHKVPSTFQTNEHVIEHAATVQILLLSPFMSPETSILTSFLSLPAISIVFSYSTFSALYLLLNLFLFNSTLSFKEHHS